MTHNVKFPLQLRVSCLPENAMECTCYKKRDQWSYTTSLASLDSSSSFLRGRAADVCFFLLLSPPQLPSGLKV